MVIRDQNAVLWSKLGQEIAALLGCEQTSASLQLLSPGKRLPCSSEDDLQRELERLVGYLPQAGPIYAARNKRVIDAYRQVLLQINPGNFADASAQADYEAKEQDALQARQRADSFTEGKRAEWQEQVQQFEAIGEESLSFEEFFQAYQNMYETLQTNADRMAGLAEEFKQTNSQRSQFLEAVGKLYDQLGADEPLPPWNFQPDPWSILSKWQENQAMIPKTVTLEHTFTRVQTEFNSPAFWGIGEQGGGMMTALMKEDVSCSWTIEFASQVNFTALPGRWADFSLLCLYRDGPWIQGSSFASGQSHPWGAGGLFPVMPTQLYVVYNPIIKLCLNQTVYLDLKRSLQQKIGADQDAQMKIGPFSFEKGGDTVSTREIAYDDSECTIVVSDCLDQPQVIAVVSQIMP